MELGAKFLLRVGTCGALDSTLALGELLVVTEALPHDGTSTALGAQGPLSADPALLASLLAAAPKDAARGRVVSTDLFYGAPRRWAEEWLREGACGVEMETATLFVLAGARDLRAGCILVVSDLLSPARARIGTKELEAAELRLGEVAFTALLDAARS
jgi:uridine phosphorylase